MTSSERLAYAVGTAAFSPARRKLAKLIRSAARGRLAGRSGAEGGGPPFAPTALPSSLPLRRAENSHAMPRPATLSGSWQERGRISAGIEAANGNGWAGARGTGERLFAPEMPFGPAGGALARIGGGAGA